MKVACIGEATAEELAGHGVFADLVPSEYTSKALGEALLAVYKADVGVTTMCSDNCQSKQNNEYREESCLPKQNNEYREESCLPKQNNEHLAADGKVLMLRAAEASPVLGQMLREHGIDCEERAIYSLERGTIIPELREYPFDAVILASAGGVRAFYEMLNDAGEWDAVRVGRRVGCAGGVHWREYCIGMEKADRAGANRSLGEHRGGDSGCTWLTIAQISSLNNSIRYFSAFEI